MLHQISGVPLLNSAVRALADRAVSWLGTGMLRRIGRLFVIKTRLDTCFVVYALALGALLRGQLYLHEYPGFRGVLLFLACLGAVFMAGAKLFESTRPATQKRGRRWTD